MSQSSAEEELALDNAISWELDQDKCNIDGISLVSDISGDSSLSSSRFELSGEQLTIDTSSSFYGDIFVKSSTFKEDVFAVEKVQVTICGDQEVSVANAQASVYSINLAASVSGW